MAVLFEKTKLLTDKQFHYCPGCNHGIIHRLVAEVIDEMKLDGKVIGVAPVGCSVFAYDYFNCDMYEAAHGRAPAVATGIKRSVGKDTLVFTYQGFKYVGVAGKQISQGMEITMMYMYGIMPVCGIICAICVVIKIITLYKADISFFAPSNQALTKEDA